MRKIVIKNTAANPVYDLTEIVRTLESEGGVGSFSVIPVPGSRDIMVVYSNVEGV